MSVLYKACVLHKARVCYTKQRHLAGGIAEKKNAHELSLFTLTLQVTRRLHFLLP